MIFIANFEGTPLSTGRSESLLIVQSLQVASSDYFYKIEIKMAPSSRSIWLAVFPTQRKQRSRKGSAGWGHQIPR